MSYALVVGNVVQSESGTLPAQAPRLDDPTLIVLGLPSATVADQQACGWYAVTDTPRPTDTSTKTYDRSITNQAGTWTVTWTQRDKTQAELAAATQQANGTTLRTLAAGAIQTNLDALALANPTAANTTYLGIGSPTNAQVAAQVRALTQQNNALVAQVRALTQQNNYLIRLAVNALDATS